jgi:hypothetical protein
MDDEKIRFGYCPLIGTGDLQSYGVFFERFDKEVDAQVAEIRSAFAAFPGNPISGYDSPIFLAHRLRDRFWNLGFMRAGDLTNRLYRTDWVNNREQGSQLLDAMEDEVQHLKRIARGVAKGEIAPDRVIEISGHLSP